MKRNLIGILSLVVLSVLLTATGAAAQSSVVVRADVPFAFHVGGRQMPAGSYQVNVDADHNRFTLLSNNKTPSTYSQGLWAQNRTPNKGARLVFHQVAGQYFLSAIWGGRYCDGMTIPATKLEKELELAQGTPNAGDTVVTARN